MILHWCCMARLKLHLYWKSYLYKQKTFYMQKEENISLEGLYERQARTKSINREKLHKVSFKRAKS